MNSVVTSSEDSTTLESTVGSPEDLQEVSLYRTIELRPHQVEHFDRVVDILSRFYFYIDGSKGGTGKTIIAGAAALQMQLPVIVICPVTVKAQWEEFISGYGIPYYFLETVGAVFSYDMLRSRKGIPPKHGLLTREDRNKTTTFHATSLWRDIVANGVMLILDECQKSKNLSGQNKACRALIREIYRQGGRSRIGLLSGTPIDKEEQVTNFVRMVGMVTSRNLYSKVQGKVRLEGVEELQTWARQANPEPAEQFIQAQPFHGTKAGATNYIYRLFVEVIRPKVMSIMPNPLDQNKDIKNGYYHLDSADELEYRRGIDDLAKATRYNPEHNLVDIDGANMGAITHALTRVQLAKVKALIRVTRSKLAETFLNPQGQPGSWKVVIFASYYSVIDLLLAGLADFQPVELTGRVPEAKRTTNIRAFQELTSSVRILIGNPLVGGLGVNLQDLTPDGTLPRWMFILADYRINELLQASDRTTRQGMTGRSYVRMFYGITGSTETSIINALSTKGRVMREVTLEQTHSGAVFPDQFENEFEPALI